MAVEHETSASLYFKMTAAVLWRDELKIEHGENYEKTKIRLFAILEWLGRANLGNPFVASCDLTSYFKLSVPKYVLNYGPSIFINYDRFPYSEHKVNEWFEISSDTWPERGESVMAINVNKDGFARKCHRTQNQVENAFPDSLEDAEFEVLSHGTSHQHAKKIIEDGIDLRYGKLGNDFSNGSSFYLTKRFDSALNWAGNRHGKEIAVLVFRLNKTELRGDNNEKGYDLRNPAKKKEWQEVIINFSSERPSKKFLKPFKDYQFIEGPIAKDRTSRYPAPKVDSHQLCVREESCAKLFDRSLHSVLFFDRKGRI